MKYSILLALCLVLLPVAGQADLYRWVDERGVEHFSDKPPRGPGAKQLIRLEESAPPDPATLPEAPAPPAHSSAGSADPAAAPAEPSSHAVDPPVGNPPVPEAMPAAAPPGEPSGSDVLETWTLPLELPSGEQQFRLQLPPKWRPLDREALDTVEEMIHQEGGDVRVRSGFLAGPGRALLINFAPTGSLEGLLARLPRLPEGWKNPALLPEDRRIFDRERGAVWHRKTEGDAEMVSTLVILDEGRLEFVLITPHTRYDEDVRVLAQASATLELPRGAAPARLLEKVKRVQKARGLVSGVGSAVMLLIVWGLLGRVKHRGLQTGLQVGAFLGSFFLVPALVNFWGADFELSTNGWLYTLLVLGIPLLWRARRRKARARRAAADVSTEPVPQEG